MKNEIDGIKVGEYVRTKSLICKIVDITTSKYLINNNKLCFEVDTFVNSNQELYLEDIIKHSHNLIELIEYGDLVKFKGWGTVKGLDVIDMRTNEKVSLVFPHAEFCNGWINNCMIYDLDFLVEKDQSNKIDWVLTHEQIKHNCYKVKE